MSLISKKQSINYILSAIMLLTLLNSGYFFLAILKLNIGQWLAFNACSLSIIAYLICYILYKIKKKNYLLAIPLLPLYYYGTMGLFLMPWDQANIFSQITHIVITVNVLWILYILIKENDFESIGKGALLGIIFFVPIFAYIQSYTQLHIDEFLKVLKSM